MPAVQGYKWKPDAPLQQREGDAAPREPTDPCSHWYPGLRPFQAPEVNNIANWVMTLPNLVGFFDLRSYGQMRACASTFPPSDTDTTPVSSPYSYSCKRVPADAEDQIEAGLGAARALMDVHGTEFMVSIMDGDGILLGNLIPPPDRPTLPATVSCARKHR